MKFSSYILDLVSETEKLLNRQGFSPKGIKLDTDSPQIFIGLSFTGFEEEKRPDIHAVFSAIEKQAKSKHKKLITLYIRPMEF